KILTTEEGEVKADVLNYIPRQKANNLATDSGLTKGDWCPINTKTFESKLVKDVHIIGDAAIASSMPKSGFSANSQAKVAALQIARLLRKMPIMNPPKLANTCYSLVAPNYGISVAAVYEADGDTIKKVKGSGGLSPMNASKDFRIQESEYAVAWYQNQMADIFK
ncbi:MAG: FCSD flavin-binding domain-containing protein, partial [Arcobacteraceae bacterium]